MVSPDNASLTAPMLRTGRTGSASLTCFLSLSIVARIREKKRGEAIAASDSSSVNAAARVTSAPTESICFLRLLFRLNIINSLHHCLVLNTQAKDIEIEYGGGSPSPDEREP